MRATLKQQLSAWLARYWRVAAAFLLVFFLTGAHFQGDTLYYVDAVLLRVHGGRYVVPETGPNYQFWEFGHLLWRPLGWAVWQVAEPVARRLAGGDERAGLTLVFIALNWISAFASALLVRALAGRVTRRAWAADFAAVSLVFAHGFLNYGQTGCSYVPGLALLLAAFYLLTGSRGGGADANAHARAERSDDSEASSSETSFDVAAPTPLRAAFAGLALAGAICLWVPHLLAAPAALSVPLVLGRGGWRSRLGRRALAPVLIASLACAAGVGVAYFGALAAVGIDSLAEFRAWASAASHGLARGHGAPAVAFGLARSFVNVGDDGVVLKRFLVGDPLNPVTVFDLLRGSVLLIALVYLWLGATLLAVVRARAGRRLLLLLAVNAAPVLAFAFYWQGTVMERYMPAYPAVFLALAYALDRGAGRLRPLAAVLAAAIICVNGFALSSARLGRREAAAAARVEELRARLRTGGRVFIGKDELALFPTDFPLHPLNRRGWLAFTLYSFVSLDKPDTDRWREDFGAAVVKVWEGGGDAWVSRRVVAERPKPEWGWVEGADPRVRWGDIHAFFAPLRFTETVGGDDGFALLPPTPENRAYLEAHASERPPADEGTAGATNPTVGE